MRRPVLILALATLAAPPAFAAADREALGAEVDRRAAEVLPTVVALRRDFHQHPELGNRETRTAGIVADRLRQLGYEVKTGVAHTGVVGLLRGASPGPVVALRSDMDALPVTEEVDLPFRSTEKATYNGQEVGVMHACGHDNHLAILLGAAEVLAGIRERLPGTVKLIFQPAEEGPPQGEEGGAELMVKEGVLEDPAVDAIFGLHVFPLPVGTISVRAGGVMAASDRLEIRVRGRQTHGAWPWKGVDPVVTAAQIVVGLQTVVSRQLDLTTAPAVVTVATFHGGARYNIIPDEVELTGTIRTLDPAMREEVHRRIRTTAESIAASAGATAEVTIELGPPVTYNDPQLTARMTPTLAAVAGDALVTDYPPQTVAEDFAVFQQKVPGVFFFLGVTPEGADPATVAPNHSPRFFADEGGLIVGVKAMTHMAVDYLTGGP